MRKGRDEASTERRPAVELVLTGRRLPGFALLLAAMLAELTLVPFIELLPGGTVIVELITAAVLLAALVVVGSHRTAVVLFATALLVHIVATWLANPGVLMAARVFRLVFLGYVIGLVFRRVLGDRDVTLDTVAGAACVYMLIGVVWGDLFILLQSWRPDAFHIPARWIEGTGRSLESSLTYFSFSTLTTVGYGDIHPNDPAAGSLCAAEGIVGQLYLAIMIARLVGLHTSRGDGERRGSS